MNLIEVTSNNDFLDLPEQPKRINQYRPAPLREDIVADNRRKILSITHELARCYGTADRDKLYPLCAPMSQAEYDAAVEALLDVGAITEHNKILHLEV